MMQPMNYTIDTGNQGQAFQQGMQQTAGMMATVADYQKAQAMATAAQQKAEADQYKRERYSQVSQNPTTKEVRRLYMEFPELHEATGKMLDHLSAEQKRNTQEIAFSVGHALKKGNIEAAKAVIDKQIDASRASGDQEALQGAEALRTALDVDPNVVEAQIQGILYSTMGKDYADIEKKYEEAETERKTRDSTVRKGAAEATTAETTVRYAAATAQAALAKTGAEIADKKSAISERAARLGLDRDKFNLEFESKLAELQGKTQVTLSSGMEKMQADSVGKAIEKQGYAKNALNIASQMESLQSSGGLLTRGWNATMRAAGFEGDAQALRNEYARIRAQGVITSIPQGLGSMSNLDREFFERPFPAEDADPKYIAQFLRSLSKVQEAEAMIEERKAEWISNVGSLSTAKRDIDVSGVKVPAGTSFTEFIKRSSAASPSTSGAPAKADLNYFTQKYK